MKHKLIYIAFLVTVLTVAVYGTTFAQANNSAKIDTTGTLRFPFEDEGEFDYPDEVDEKPLYLSRPGNIERKFEYDPETQQYIIYEKVGNITYRWPKTMGLKEFVEYDFNRSIRDYWRTRKETEDIEVQQNGLIPQLKIESEAFSNIFGSDVIDIKPQGYVEVQFGLESNYIGDETLPDRLQRVTNFDFETQINVSVNGKIGDKVNMNFNYNTEATFDFENKMKMEYNGKEDEILRHIEAGNVSLPLNGSLIQGGTNLFGVKTEMQFGKVNLTTVLSQHKGESQTIETEGGAQKTKFEISATDYDENRHFFLSKYFRDHYDEALSMLPNVVSPIKITRIEVWVTNKTKDFTSARDIVAFVDLGEVDGNLTNKVPEFYATGEKYPANSANNMYSHLLSNYEGIRSSADITKTLAPLNNVFSIGTDWDKIDQARRLSDSEYTLNAQLGYISLKTALNGDEVLAVAYQYTIGSEIYNVGEFSDKVTPAEKTMVLKLIKGTNLSPNLPTWDLMMKNIYSLGGYDLNSNDFDFQVVYKNDATNSYINYLPEGELKDTVLLQLMNLDNLNSNGDYMATGDGMFDFVEGYTVLSSNAKIIFPVLEPFGKNIRKNLSDPKLQDKYAFDAIYTESKTDAQNKHKEQNKFAMIGSYKGSSGSEIQLNSFNLARGSVKVSAGGRELAEDIDYVVDYAMGRVKIINDGLIEAGTPIQVSTESQELISTQRKTMIGSYASYAVSDKLNIGGTLLYMNERPITTKVDMGDEPVTNMMLGLDFQYNDRSRFLTDLVNLLPFYDSDVESSISIEGEVAKLITGKSKTTGNQVYLDDFEGVETPYSFNYPTGWSLASTPQKQPLHFPESDSTDNLAVGYNRAKLAWYYIDRNIFNASTSSDMPAFLKADADLRSNHYTRDVEVKELFPDKDLAQTANYFQTVMNVAYYPSEKGPYNFDADPTTVSAGVDQDGKLNDPASRWGGMMKEINTPNFEAANIEYIEFWMMDPFIYDDGTHKGGNLYFNLGNVSEDVLKDSRKAFENGLPIGEVSNVDTTAWGRVSTKTQLGTGFEDNGRSYQDIGLDGLSDADETSYFESYLEKVGQIVAPEVYEKILKDPANDDYANYRSTEFDENEVLPLERYKNYNNPEGNTPTYISANEQITSSRSGPDLEDINGDNTLSELESYYQYKVPLRPGQMEIGQNFIVDKVARVVRLANLEYDTIYWYQFKVPVTDENVYETYGDIADFKSIRFMRMFLSDFADSVILRFGTLALVRADWRKEENELTQEGGIASTAAQFELTSINIEENGNRKPINYILPPDIEREVDPSNPQMTEMNEQSMLLKVINLEKGDARAVYKDMGVDMRQYKRLRMEVHAEEISGYPLDDYEMSLFIRMGTDEMNYYEYEIPLKLTPEPVGSYKGDDKGDRLLVWPDENRLDIELKKFSDLKLTRDEEARKVGSGVSRNKLYSIPDKDDEFSKNILRVIGNPSIGEVEVMHIGLRNPLTSQSPKSVEVWVNELRMSDFDVRGGWASNGRMSLRLADLGSISLSGSTQSVGWGGINDMASQRSLENRYQFDLAATTELGKLVPEKIGLHMPLFYSISKSIANPEYNPLSSDIKMSDALALIDSPEEKDSLLNASQEVSIRKSFNLNNVSVEPKRKKADRKPLPTDIENFSVSYSKNEQLSHDIDVEKYLITSQKGVFNYNYSLRSKPITPFKSVDFLKGKAFKIITDFNFNLLPEVISFRTDLTRDYRERKARNNTGLNFDLPTSVQKDFEWNRYFDFRYNLTNALSIDFTNKNVSRIDELDGVMDKELFPDEYQLMMDEIYRNLASFGRPTDYEHSIKINYRIPINKLPLLDWTSASVNYSGDYGWNASSLLARSTDGNPVEIGNAISNGMNIRGNAQLTMLTLYNKVPYFKEVNSKFQTTSRTYGSRARNQERESKKEESDKPKRVKKVKFIDNNVNFRADVPKSIFHRLGTKDVTVAVLNERGDTVKGEVSVVDINRVNFKPEVAVRAGKVVVLGQREIEESIGEQILGHSVRALLGIRNIRATYSRTGGTQLNGFLPEPYLFGSRNYDPDGAGSLPEKLAPALPFLLGWQDRNFALAAAENGWITTDNTFQKPYVFNNSENYSFNVAFEPIADLKIDFTGTWRQSSNYESLISYDVEKGKFVEEGGIESGNFDMTIMTLKTLFRDNLKDTLNQSLVFDDFRNNNLPVIVSRLEEQRGWNGNEYTLHNGDDKQGVSKYSTDAIIPAFIAAYTGMDPKTIPLTARPGLTSIRPNWRLNYRGNPQKIDWMKNIFNSFNITHSYKSNYTVGRFETNLDYNPDENGLSWTRDDLEGNFVPELFITAINIQEAFNPLINIDLGFVNDLTTSVQVSKTRNLNFDFANRQLSEMVKNEYSIGLGYRFTGMDMIIKSRQKSETVSNDVNLRFDLTSSNYKNILRKMDEAYGEVNGGSRVLSMDFQADYMVSDKLTVKLYYQYSLTDPHTTNNGFVRSNTKFGLSFNFAIM